MHPVAAAALVIFALCYVLSFFWVIGDARARGKSGLLAACLVLLLAFPMGFILWLLIRPGRSGRGRNDPVYDRPGAHLRR
jgi:hypothetical protein